MLGRGVVVAVDFVDRELEPAVVAGQAEICDVALPFRPLHGLEGRAGLVAAVDHVADVNNPAGTGDCAAARGFRNHRSGEAVQPIDDRVVRVDNGVQLPGVCMCR